MLPICSTLLPISRASLWSRMAHFREIASSLPEHGFEGEEPGFSPRKHEHAGFALTERGSIPNSPGEHEMKLLPTCFVLDSLPLAAVAQILVAPPPPIRTD